MRFKKGQKMSSCSIDAVLSTCRGLFFPEDKLLKTRAVPRYPATLTAKAPYLPIPSLNRRGSHHFIVVTCRSIVLQQNLRQHLVDRDHPVTPQADIESAGQDSRCHQGTPIRRLACRFITSRRRLFFGQNDRQVSACRLHVARCVAWWSPADDHARPNPLFERDLGHLRT